MDSSWLTGTLNNLTVVLWSMLALVLLATMLVAVSSRTRLKGTRFFAHVHANRRSIIANFFLSALLIGLLSNVLTLFGLSSGDIFPRPDADHVRVIYGTFSGLEKCTAKIEYDVRSMLIERMLNRDAFREVKVTVRTVDLEGVDGEVAIERILHRYRSDVFVDGTYRINCSDKPISLALRYMSSSGSALRREQVDSMNVDDLLAGRGTSELEDYIKSVARRDAYPMDF